MAKSMKCNENKENLFLDNEENESWDYCVFGLAFIHHRQNPLEPRKLNAQGLMRTLLLRLSWLPSSGTWVAVRMLTVRTLTVI
jgi:hypothetical protein